MTTTELVSLSGTDAQSHSSLNYLTVYSSNEFHHVANERGLLSLSFSQPTIVSRRRGQLHYNGAHSHVCLMFDRQIRTGY